MLRLAGTGAVLLVAMVLPRVQQAVDGARHGCWTAGQMRAGRAGADGDEDEDEGLFAGVSRRQHSMAAGKQYNGVGRLLGGAAEHVAAFNHGQGADIKALARQVHGGGLHEAHGWPSSR